MLRLRDDPARSGKFQTTISGGAIMAAGERMARVEPRDITVLDRIGGATACGRLLYAFLKDGSRRSGSNWAGPPAPWPQPC